MAYSFSIINIFYWQTNFIFCFLNLKKKIIVWGSADLRSTNGENIPYVLEPSGETLGI